MGQHTVRPPSDSVRVHHDILEQMREEAARNDRTIAMEFRRACTFYLRNLAKAREVNGNRGGRR